jgi:trimeric autotransporter adhesin
MGHASDLGLSHQKADLRGGEERLTGRPARASAREEPRRSAICGLAGLGCPAAAKNRTEKRDWPETKPRFIGGADAGPHPEARRSRPAICFLLAATILALTVPAATAPRRNPLPPEATGPAANTMRAYDFYSKFGVNTDISTGETISSILVELQYLGVYNLRDSIFSAGYANAFAALAAEGVQLHMDFQGWINPAPAMSDWMGWLKTYLVSPYPGSVIGVSGPNEVDSTGSAFVYAGLSGIPAANLAQRNLYNGINADPVLHNIPVDMWPLAYATSSAVTAEVGNQTAYCGRANMHDYYFPDDYTPSVSAAGDMQAQIPLYLADYQKVCDRAQWVTTETGWVTPYAGGNMFSKEVSEDVQAKLLLSDLFDHAMLPNCQAVYIFDLLWGSEDASDPGWGVFHNDGTPKESGTAIRDLMAILHDPGADAATFTPGSFEYSLSGMPSASGNFVVAKSDGSFDILLWNETPIWNLTTERQLSIPTSTVTISLPPGSSGSIYQPIAGAAPITTFTNVGQLQVGLNDSPLIIEVQ